MDTKKVTLKFPSQLSYYLNNEKEICFYGENILDLINDLDQKYGNIKEKIVEEGNVLKPYLTMFIGKENINSKNGLKTPLKDGNTLTLLLSRAGG
jgi:molybdopterin converting factor small subunit